MDNFQNIKPYHKKISDRSDLQIRNDFRRTLLIVWWQRNVLKSPKYLTLENVQRSS